MFDVCDLLLRCLEAILPMVAFGPQDNESMVASFSEFFEDWSSDDQILFTKKIFNEVLERLRYS
jgi:hypothetical protein